MNKEFVPYKIALKLRDLGFDGKCFATTDQTEYIHIKGTRYGTRGAMCYDTIKCPSWGHVTQWLREMHNLHINIGTTIGQNWKSLWIVYRIERLDTNEIDQEIDSDPFATYEAALQFGIDEALKLIEK